jgi:hypothetical protein
MTLSDSINVTTITRDTQDVRGEIFMSNLHEVFCSMLLIGHRKFSSPDRTLFRLFMKRANPIFAHNPISKSRLQFHSCCSRYSTELSLLTDMDHEEYTSRLQLAVG